MRHTLQLRLFTFLTIILAPLSAQQAPDPTGHWKGGILAPGQQFRFEIDLVKNEAGVLAGTVTLPDEDLKGIPLKLTVSGTSIRFHAREDQPFDGELSADGKSIDGETTLVSYTLPFHMARTGDPVAEKATPGLAIPKAIEGEWRGTLEAGGASLKLVLIFANVADGSTARIIDLDQGGLELPVVVRQAAPLAFDIAGGASWSGSVNAEGTELTGSYREHDKSAPLNFRRDPAR